MSRNREVSRSACILPWTWLTIVGVVSLVVTTGCDKPPATSSETGDSQAAAAPCCPAADTEDCCAADKAPCCPAAGTEDCCAVAITKAELLVELPLDLCNTPDAMTLLPDGNVILSVPNFNDPEQPPLLMKITTEGKAEKFFDLPPNPDSGEPFGSLGLCSLPSGDLLIADFQMTENAKSRVARIVMKDGKPVEAVTAITGFAVSNAVIVHDGFVYVSDTQIDAEAKPCISGVFRFKLDELEGEKPVTLNESLLEDPHLIGTIETFDEEVQFGADGLAFDDAGNLYIGNFADGTVHRFQFDEKGAVTSNEIFAKADCMKSADGLFWDAKRKQIYVADSKANAVQIVSLDGSVKVLAQNGDTDGLDGGMDQPCEALLRGNDLIVSNMDWPVPGCINKEYNKPCTLSVIRIE